VLQFCLRVYGYPYVSSESPKTLVTVPDARSRPGSMPGSVFDLDIE
jgi:hypothetical protein